MASVSHLPHVLANVLVGQASGLLSAERERLPATGPSFRDATRVAGASTAIWRDIYLANADALSAAIDDAIERLAVVRSALAGGDAGAIAAWNDGAREDRRRLLEADLAGGTVHELRVPVPNRPGVIADIALALGRGGVNIVDMALYPVPDRSEGTVALWIGTDGEARRAEELLAELGLPVARA
jgi:prephenate dehydrogenase